MIDKKCSGCNNLKHVSNFTIRNDKKDYPIENLAKYGSYCKECQSLNTKLKFFKITKQEYFELLERCGMKCCICGISEENSRNKRSKHMGLYIDHCHLTGRVRGLLCHSCNLVIGHAKDNVAVLKSAIDYLLL